MTRRHDSTIASIVPPYMLEAIAQRGTPQQQRRALRTLGNDQAFRLARLTPRRGRSSQAIGEDRQKGEVRRTVYDAHQRTELPGEAVRHEGDPEVKDIAANEAYDGLGATHQLYWEIYERASIDNQEMPLDGVVHYDIEYNNAFWDGAYMVFGDGDGIHFNRFTIALEVIGHELTHGVTEHEAGLEYRGQPGALNESVSDVFGSLVKQYALQQEAAAADWLIGAGLFTSQVQGVALRSMKDPGTAYDDPVLGKDPQPKHMRNYVHTQQDNGGVHINSGIPNHAFYQVAITLGGYAWEKAGRIWYETLCDPELRPGSSFQAFASRTLTNTARLYGPTSTEHKAVQDAWNSVGIHVS